jgi:hypothetical protein
VFHKNREAHYRQTLKKINYDNNNNNNSVLIIQFLHRNSVAQRPKPKGNENIRSKKQDKIIITKIGPKLLANNNSIQFNSIQFNSNLFVCRDLTARRPITKLAQS